MTARMTSREFNQDTAKAKRAAEHGPVYVTDRGTPSHVLLSFEEYTRLVGKQPSIVDLLCQPEGVGEIDFEVSASREVARPAQFD